MAEPPAPLSSPACLGARCSFFGGWLEQAGELQTWTLPLLPPPAALKSPLAAAPALCAQFTAIDSASESNLGGFFKYKVSCSMLKILLRFI